MKLTEHIYLVGSGYNGLHLTDSWDCNCYLLRLKEGLVLFDCGAGLRPHLLEEEMRKDGLSLDELKYLCITHCHGDHIGAAAYLREKYNLRVIVPEAEAQFLETGDEIGTGLKAARAAGFYPEDYVIPPCSVDVRVKNGQVLNLCGTEFTIYEARGHSVCGACYYAGVDGQKVLVSGDIVFSTGKISLQVIPGADVHAYVKSVKVLNDITVDILLPGHQCFLLHEGGRAITLADEAFRRLLVPAG